MIQLTGAASIQIVEAATTRRDQLIAASAEFTEIENGFIMECAADVMREMKEFSVNVEKSRVDVKAPVLEWGRTIDGLAKNLLTPIEAEQKRLKKLMDTYAAEQRRIAEEAERKRQLELKRIADEQARIAREKAAAEVAAANALTAEEEARAEEQKRIAEAKQREVEAQTAKVSTAVAAPKVDGVTVRKVWRFQVFDLVALYASNPLLCRLEANTSAINDAIRNGARNIPGLKIWEETETQVRR